VRDGYDSDPSPLHEKDVNMQSDPHMEVPVQHTMHVATDDKTVLAQMAASASAPDSGPTIMSCQPRAPPWIDDPLNELLEDETPSFSASSPHLRPPSPPPESQVDVSRYAFEEDDAFLYLHRDEPSAPPQENFMPNVASAPLFDDFEDEALPSAS